ncbi:methyltransferase domain-containing protein [Halobacillus shinanisalinarum]|uniref:Methyltransferase domain-containing protein n=1 Tax=Halobacillus shinanisalinarum TaxID=2932258 RepID=A0ABY4GY63_9BACI|nr:methyltransferase domain-containing protein [Halobacillus shinanisalinarum]UOQ92357.1 methyltransferase domain-containing protein [Halobacillus shinanisalinarum]
MKITEAARTLHTTARTIRFYEEKGLVRPRKGENDYRYYKEVDLWKLQTILALREIGMSTGQIKEALEGEVDRKAYLDLQRSVLYEEWLQIKDMITTVDEMLIKQKESTLSTEDIFILAHQLKTMKQLRKSWEDQWNFNDQAEEYDQTLKTTGYRFNVHEHYHEALAKVNEIIEAVPGEWGVDIGTGTGNLAARFLEKGSNMIGIDQSEEMLKVCSKKHPKMDLRHGHFLSLPVMDNKVDFVVSSYALHHIPDQEKELALGEMDRVLAENGRIALADLMFKNAEEKDRVLAQFEQEGNREAVEAIHDEYYADRSKLINWFRKRGYHVESIQFNSILYILYAEKVNV